MRPEMNLWGATDKITALSSKSEFLDLIILKLVGFAMESSDDEKDGAPGNYIPKELTHGVASNGAKFVDEPPGSDVPPEIMEDPRFYPYFQDCVGAVDGIHIPVMVAGWEGSASDLQVLNSALTRRSKLPVPEGKYYLVDNKYANMPACAIHNYIRREKPDDWIFRTYDEDTAVLQIEEPLPPIEVEQPVMHIDTQALDIGIETEQLEISSQLRDSIATEMWNDYIRDLSAM
nr:hypothetical protein CFP56_66412 [Quercus suber]